jgi:hypothetical protein
MDGMVASAVSRLTMRRLMPNARLPRLSLLVVGSCSAGQVVVVQAADAKIQCPVQIALCCGRLTAMTKPLATERMQSVMPRSIASFLLQASLPSMMALLQREEVEAEAERTQAMLVTRAEERSSMVKRLGEMTKQWRRAVLQLATEH